MSKREPISEQVNYALSLDGPNGESSYRPYLRLWIAVLNKGLQDYYSGRDGGWLGSDKNEIGSFVWLCELIDWDPDVIRRKAVAHRRSVAETQPKQPREGKNGKANTRSS